MATIVVVEDQTYTFYPGTGYVVCDSPTFCSIVDLSTCSSIVMKTIHELGTKLIFRMTDDTVRDYWVSSEQAGEAILDFMRQQMYNIGHFERLDGSIVFASHEKGTNTILQIRNNERGAIIYSYEDSADNTWNCIVTHFIA